MATAEQIVDYLRDQARRPMKAKELAHALNVPAAEYVRFRTLLRQLADEGTLYRAKRQRYAAPEKINLVTGRLQTIRSGAGFVVPEEGEDLFVPAEALASAVDGDRVVARVERRRRGERPRGTIIRVLERGRQTIVGLYHPSRNFGFATPEDRKLSRDVFVPPGQDGGAQAGEVVVVRVTDWGDGHKGPVGEVERVLGPLDRPGVDVLAILYGHELPLHFPAEVEAEAAALDEQGVLAAELERRLDLRAALVFTIDPADARDHDDALSLRPLDNGNVEVGVHIADVSHYVRPGTALDREALRRGTSVYLVDRVVPMLPESLSHGLCSLLPDVDRLALSVLFELDDDARVLHHRLVRTVINCKHRLAYEDAETVLKGEGAIAPDLDDALRRLDGIATALRRRRVGRGSIDFDLPEARVVLDEEGAPVDIQRVQRLESHRLIEDFMLLANETIAQRAAAADIPFLYRIHEPPSEDRLEALSELLASFGIRLGTDDPKPRDFQAVMRRAEGRPEETLISTVMLRSMKQARYSADNSGHFGLAAEAYTHFTSPIRRYPDLVVHRRCASVFIDAEAPDEGPDPARIHDVARISSERERVAVDAERDSVDLKKVEFMERHVGDEFEGTVSGVTAFGLFILLDRFFVEGLVHVGSLDDDYYVFVEEQFALVGENTGRRFRLGDRAKVRVARTSTEERKIDFDLLEGGRGGRGHRGRRRKSFDTSRRRK